MHKTEKPVVIDFDSDKAEWQRGENEKKKAERRIQLENKKEEERLRREAAELK